MPIEDFFNNYSDKGYVFSDEILSRYALSLASKPFVILSGISGTGKTKIAQLFDIPNNPVPAQPEEIPDIAVNNGYILLTVTDGLANGDGRANLKFNQLSSVLEDDDMQMINQAIQEKKTANDGGNICDPINLKIISHDNQELDMGLYLQRANSPLVRIRAKSKRGEINEYDSRGYFAANFNIGDVIKLEKVEHHVLKITSVNDENIIQENQVNEREVINNINTKCFISVKSNWTDSSELFGYFNPLTQKYNITKLLKFMLLAADHPETPFFVILDEMNLSKVEHYFSDFLSCLESRDKQLDGTVTQEGINLYAGHDFIPTDDQEYDEISSTINIPLNLYVTGTVNIDDTTYMFSPKVLDRANVLEINEVYFGDEPIEGGLKLTSIPDYSKYTKSELIMSAELEADTLALIKKTLGILKEFNMHFGYRTIAEVSHFIINSKSHATCAGNIETVALDIQIVQKILPKFHGNYEKLNKPILKLIHALSGSDVDENDFDLGSIENIIVDDTDFPRSLTRLIRMYNNLTTQGFANFIE
ncbi:hypothetical protein GCM10009133_13570 [Cocleimonas flava]|uniref:Dynein-related subfamily AAA family protein n=1 Tax=Cocleimonas flava TaxID=634765 RepID=A0A4R1F546_9GAMM|nr:hypothetical protein [Cocleimonas flava]TCJ87724.1 hypothetical protein EV695_2239 [Cocleimonas flava]